MPQTNSKILRRPIKISVIISYGQGVATRYGKQRQRQEYAGPRADHDRAGPEYRYLDWYATANTDYVDYGTKDIQVLHYGI